MPQKARRWSSPRRVRRKHPGPVNTLVDVRFTVGPTGHGKLWADADYGRTAYQLMPFGTGSVGFVPRQPFYADDVAEANR